LQNIALEHLLDNILFAISLAIENISIIELVDNASRGYGGLSNEKLRLPAISYPELTLIKSQLFETHHSSKPKSICAMSMTLLCFQAIAPS